MERDDTLTLINFKATKADKDRWKAAIDLASERSGATITRTEICVNALNAFADRVESGAFS